MRWLAYAIDKAKKDNPTLSSKECNEVAQKNIDLVFDVQDLVIKKWFAAGRTKKELESIYKAREQQLITAYKQSGYRAEQLDMNIWNTYLVQLQSVGNKGTGKTRPKVPNNTKGKIMFTGEELQEVEIKGCRVSESFQYYSMMGPVALQEQLGTCKAGAITNILNAYAMVARGYWTCAEAQNYIAAALNDFNICDYQGNPGSGGGNGGSGSGSGSGGNSISLPDLDVSELNNHPKFKELVQDLPNFLKKYPNILKALSYTTGFTEAEIRDLMQPGKGPKVVVVKDLKDKNGNDILGHFDNVTKKLQVDDGYVNGIDIVKSPVAYQAIGLMLTVTTLHEFVHFGRDSNQLSNKIEVGNRKYEAGWYFEGAITPDNLGQLGPDTAVDWLKYYTIKKD